MANDDNRQMHETASSDRLERPIFFIGMPRSGTTVIFEAFAAHQDLGWISNYSSRFPEWPLTGLALRLADNGLWNVRGRKKQLLGRLPVEKLLPRPLEAYPFWERFCGRKFLWDFSLEKEQDPDARMRLRQVIGEMLWYQGKPRFTAKFTGSPRIRYLRSIFPDAVFVHVIRDGRAVVNSLLRVAFWKEKGGLDSPFWTGSVSEADIRELDQFGNRSVALAAIQWRNVIQATRTEAGRLPGGDYIEIRYEDFMRLPLREQICNLYEKCGLEEIDPGRWRLCGRSEMRNMNEKYKSMDREDLDIMSHLMGDTLVSLGYR